MFGKTLPLVNELTVIRLETSNISRMSDKSDKFEYPASSKKLLSSFNASYICTRFLQFSNITNAIFYAISQLNQHRCIFLYIFNKCKVEVNIFQISSIA